MADIYVGVDVSKDWIDIFHPEHGASRLRQAPEVLAKWECRKTRVSQPL